MLLSHQEVIVYKDGLPPDAIEGGFETREQRPNVIPLIECWDHDS